MEPVTLDKRIEMRTRPDDDSPLMSQNWRDLLFLHWKAEPKKIQSTLPPGLFVDTFEGDAYITISPFFIKNLKMAGSFPIPGLTEFIEVNMRTYVYDKSGNPGIWFYSLDINSTLASSVARQLFSLPYHHADLAAKQNGNQTSIFGHRKEHPPMEFSYQPEGAIYSAEPGSLDFYLIERYALFNFNANQLSVARVHHNNPYPLSKVKVYERLHPLFEVNSLETFFAPPSYTHYSSGVDVEIFRFHPVLTHH